jgi:putative CocE/NonD family hydrolase
MVRRGVSTVLVERNVTVPMRDGALLTADVYRQASDEPCPALLQRTPYGRTNAHGVGGLTVNPLEAVARGYAVVVQDVRGRFGSEGTFTPLVEGDDGYDTVEWIAEQPWSNGRVGVFGSSYMGLTAAQALVAAPPHLTAGVMYLTGANYYDGWVYTGGVLELGFNLRWTVALLADRLNRDGIDDELRATAQRTLTDYLGDPGGYNRRDAPGALLGDAGALLPHWKAWLEHDEYDDYWAGLDLTAKAANVRAPVLGIAGWYDGLLRGNLDFHAAITSHGPEELREQHRLVVGPWDHAAYLGPLPASAGVRDFGPSAFSGAAAVGPLVLSWFDRWTGSGDGAVDARLEAPVRYFVMGPDEWRTTAAWPPQGEQRVLYLRSGGEANSRFGDGRLAQAAASPGEPADTYVYDPADPVPTTGGRHLAYGMAPAGVAEQSPSEERGDVLVYTSETLLEPLTVTGRVGVRLYACSTAPETHFAAKLSDVDPGGSSWNVVDGIVRARDLSPSEPRLVEVDLWDVAYVFEAGHRIRISVTSSDFPRFALSVNGAPPETSPNEAPSAVQRVLHDEACPSCLVLPVAL